MRRYQYVLSLLPGGQVDGLFRDGLLGPNSGDTILESWADMTDLMSATDELRGLQFLELRSTLPDELLMYADKLSMANSLEVRVPYLDRTVVEYAQRLGARYKMRNGTGKWLHRKVCERFLPPRFLKRKKRGFAVNVVDSWFNSSLQGKLPEMLLDESSLMFDLVKPQSVRKLLEDHRSGRHDNHKLLFSLVMYEQWLRGSRLDQERIAHSSAQVDRKTVDRVAEVL